MISRASFIENWGDVMTQETRIDKEDARQADARKLNLRVLMMSTIAVAVILALLYFAFGFGPTP